MSLLWSVWYTTEIIRSAYLTHTNTKSYFSSAQCIKLKHSIVVNVMSPTTVMSMEPSISSSLAEVDPSLGYRRRRRLAMESRLLAVEDPAALPHSSLEMQKRRCQLWMLRLCYNRVTSSTNTLTIVSSYPSESIFAIKLWQ